MTTMTIYEQHFGDSGTSNEDITRLFAKARWADRHGYEVVLSELDTTALIEVLRHMGWPELELVTDHTLRRDLDRAYDNGWTDGFDEAAGAEETGP